MKNISIFVVLIVCVLGVVGQSKYFEKSISWGWVQGSNKVYFTSDTSIVMSCGSFANNTTLEKVNLLFTDQYAENHTLINYGEDFGTFGILDFITTPFGYAFCGWMNNEPYGTYPTYSYPYLMEVNHAGEILNHYQLSDPPYKGNGKTLLYYPETNTYYIGGNAFTTSANPYRLVMTKITDGEIVWCRYYDDFTDRNYITDLQPTSDGGCYVVGSVNNGTPGANSWKGDVLFMRIDANGDIIHSTTYKWGGLKAIGSRFNSFNDNSFIITGISYGIKPLLLRIDTLGNTIWAKHYELGTALSETVNVL